MTNLCSKPLSKGQYYPGIGAYYGLILGKNQNAMSHLKHLLFLFTIIAVICVFPFCAKAGPSVIDLKADCGAVGNGIADDSGALKTCISMVNADYAIRVPVYLHIPTGFYLIKGTNGPMPGFAVNVPGSIRGDGPNKSTIHLDPSYTGDLFSWSNATSTVDNPGNTVNPKTNFNTPTVTGLTIIGDLSAATAQNALMFYDLDDAVDIQDVEVYSMPGACISMGQTKNNTIAYVRESFFKNIKCWNSGTTTVPAVTIGSTTNSTSDATNELAFYKLDIFHAAGTGMVISNHNQWEATRSIKFFGLRIEDSGHDALDIGLPTDAGNVQTIMIDGLEEPVIANGYYGVRIGTNGTNAPWGINIKSLSAGTGTGSGIDIDNGWLIHIEGSFATSGPNITLGSGAGAEISFLDSQGEAPSNLTFAYSGLTTYGAALSNISTPFTARGLPTSLGKVGIVALEGSGQKTTPIRLTADGGVANTQNCFNPTYGQAFTLSITLRAQDLTNPTKSYSWSMPLASFSAWYGAGAATLATSQATSLTTGAVTGASVGLAADTTLGCLNLSFTPPTGNTDSWMATSFINFSRTP